MLMLLLLLPESACAFCEEDFPADKIHLDGLIWRRTVDAICVWHNKLEK